MNSNAPRVARCLSNWCDRRATHRRSSARRVAVRRRGSYSLVLPLPAAVAVARVVRLPIVPPAAPEAFRFVADRASALISNSKEAVVALFAAWREPFPPFATRTSDDPSLAHCFSIIFPSLPDTIALYSTRSKMRLAHSSVWRVFILIDGSQEDISNNQTAVRTQFCAKAAARQRVRLWQQKGILIISHTQFYARC